MPDLTGTTLGKYQIVERLGRGGMATVYRAYQPGMDRYVAVKVMNTDLSDDPDFVLRFKREAQSVGSLRHPNIVQVIDFDVHDDEYYMVMEYIKGDTLKSVLHSRGALPVNEALDITMKLADALAYAHDKGTIHRDIKPANILFSAPDHPILTDFGIARIMGATGLTREGAFLGTPAYMSPEAGRGEQVDARGDIYSLGIVLYEMLAGAVPYNADTPFAVILKHLNEPLPMPRDFKATLPEAAERVVLKALTKAKEDRFQSAQEFKEALAKAKEGVLIEMPTQQGRSGVGTKVLGTTKTSEASANSTSVIQRPVSGGMILIAGIVAVAVVAIVLSILIFGNKPPATPPASATAVIAVLPTASPVAVVIQTGVPTAAATVGVSASKVDPKYAQLIADARKALDSGENRDAVQGQLEIALKTDPNAYDLLVYYAEIIFAKGDRDKAESAKAGVDKALQSAPDRPDAYVAVAAYWFLRYGDNDANDDTRRVAVTNVLEALNNAISRGTDDYGAYWGRTWANSRRDVPASVLLADYEKAGSFNPQNPDFYTDRGQFYVRQGTLDKAQADFEKSLSLRPQSYVHQYLAPVYLKRNNPDAAFALYVGGIDKDKATNPDYIGDGAYVAWADKQTDKATEWANFVIQLDPANLKGNYVLALLKWDAKIYDDALKLLDKVISDTSNSYYYYPFLNKNFDRTPLADRARIIAAQGKLDEAIQAYDEAIKADDNWARLYIEQAKLYVQKGDKDNARKDLRRALELASNAKDDALITEVRKALADLGQ